MIKEFKKEDWKLHVGGKYYLTEAVPSNSYFYLKRDGKVWLCNYRIVDMNRICDLVVFEGIEPFDGIISIEELRLKEVKNYQPWTKEVVFKTYCNDNIYELPLKILEDMKSYLDNIIDNKKEIE